MTASSLGFAARFSVLGLLVTSCSLIPQRRQFGTPAPPPTATPIPPPLLALRGQGSFASSHFFAPSPQWYASWSYDCGSRSGGAISVTARPVRRSVHTPPVSVLTAVAKAGGRRGTTRMSYRGNVFIKVEMPSRCRWQITASVAPR